MLFLNKYEKSWFNAIYGYGNAFREARKSKDMTIEETCKDIMSVPSLSKLKNEKTQIWSDRFIRLLERIRVSYQEFMMIFMNDIKNSQSYFLQQLHLAVSNDNITAIQQLINVEDKQYESTFNIRHEHNTILASQSINELKGVPFDLKQTEQIFKFLLDVSDWGYYEVSLFGNAIFFFSIHQIHNLSAVAVKKASIYHSLSKNRFELVLILQNIIDIFIKENHFKPLPKIFKETDALLKGTKYIYEHNRQRYLKGLYLIKTGQVEHGKELAIKSINILSDFELYESANVLQKEMELYLKL